MKINGVDYRSIQTTADGAAVEIIDQTRLPHEFELVRMENLEDVVKAIKTMQVRGAPLIGAAAAWGLALAMRQRATDAALDGACQVLLGTRPTAVNLRWALERMRRALLPLSQNDRPQAARWEATAIGDEDVGINRRIGEHGAQLIRQCFEKKRDTVNVMTHCNAGWLATVDYGTALAPVYVAHDAGIPVHVWVSETRPRNQGASLTAWELGQHGAPHTIIVDSLAGHLMQHGHCDMVIVGTDRTTARGDVANKIGTYLKALAAHDNGVPFYVAAPGPSIDWALQDGVRDVVIETRHDDEVAWITGRTTAGEVTRVRITPEASNVRNDAFDVTPARLVTAIITERGVTSPDELWQLYPE